MTEKIDELKKSIETMEKELAEAKKAYREMKTKSLREAMEAGTELGNIAKDYVNKGNLVPADVAAKIVNEAVKKPEFKDGYILDGFPRNLEQAELFEDMDKVDFMIEFYAPEDLLI